MQELGIQDVVLDPGFGFGKSIEQQFQMIDELQHVGFGKFPLLIGISKNLSFINLWKNLLWKLMKKLKNCI